MRWFEDAVKRVEATGLPVVEGIAVKPANAGASPEQGARAALPNKGQGWDVRRTRAGWLLFGAPGPQTLSLSDAWTLVRAIRELPEVSEAEPLLLGRQPVTGDAQAEKSFGLWGKVTAARRAAIERASQDVRWAFDRLKVSGLDGKGGAHALWRKKHGGRQPGDGIVVAHPDTGYTPHPRLLARLAQHAGDAQRSGRSYVDPGAADALDPLTGQNPGHGTKTASVIAGEGTGPRHAPGVAPGATILPLRVSSSVIHLSFDNLIQALDELPVDGSVHVVSMSLGGPYASGALADTVWELLDAGVIVVSAAGNKLPTVVFPARVPGVIACAASNALDAPWRFSGLGREVAVTAPGERVWHEVPKGSVALAGDGTSYATAHVAGLAALWLSYHGRDELIEHCAGDARLLPFLFRLCLQGSARRKPKLSRDFGSGIADAEKLLRHELPALDAVRAEREKWRKRRGDSLIGFPVRTWWTILTLPTLTADARPARDPAAAVETFLKAGTLAPELDEVDRGELATLAAGDVELATAIARAAAGDASAAALRRYLLHREKLLSPSLQQKLVAAQDAQRSAWVKERAALLRAPSPPAPDAAPSPYPLHKPSVRRLRAYAFDPSLASRFADVGANEITIPVDYERLDPGPVGEYLEVVDVDPASDCVYAPVDLDHPYLLSQDGLPRSEGNPQFHQQMVYAVAMKTIEHFEQALGRPIFWRPLRPWNTGSGDRERADAGRESDQFIQRLRLYPHALRDQNAYYSPEKRAVLFGYFPAGDGDPGAEMPGGAVFTCLAHDIIAHEVTHAILDGMHVHFVERTNPDVLAFHEAFADLVALLQRFTYTDLVREQIARARGRLDTGTLLTRLGLQFGQTTGRGQSLRDAMGVALEQRRRKGDASWRDVPEEREPDGDAPRTTIADAVRDLSDEERRRVWKRFEADPTLLQEVEEPHDRGAFLVAAVFDAFVRIYEARVADLQRIATGGIGILPEGELHPDLVARLAGEASKTAGHVLKMCIRAMDYVPPLDITFGDFLRALITADSDLVVDDDRHYRVAFIEAFRKWGIYPRDVRTLSEESLRWCPPDKEVRFENLVAQDAESTQPLEKARQALLAWRPGEERRRIFDEILASQSRLHAYFEDEMPPELRSEVLPGIRFGDGHTFQVTNLRPARRVGSRGELFTEMVVEVIQTPRSRPGGAERGRSDPLHPPFRAAVTLIIGLDDQSYRVRYAISKRGDSPGREERQRSYLLRAGGGGGGAAEYSSSGLAEGFWKLPELRKSWLEGRTHRLEDMRASSCACRGTALEKKRKKTGSGPGFALAESGAEPFALLHRS